MISNPRLPGVSTIPAARAGVSRRRVATALLVVVATVATGRVRAADDADAVSLDAARAELDAGRAILVDVREPQEHAAGIAPGARPLPLSQLRARWSEIPTDPQRPVLLICGTQNRSRTVLRTLRERGGYGHVRYVTGGMTEWVRRGWPTVQPPK